MAAELHDGRTAKVINRWMVVVGAVLIQLCLGAIYAWSVFTPRLTAADPADVAAIYSAGKLGISPEKLEELQKELAPVKAALKAETKKLAEVEKAGGKDSPEAKTAQAAYHETHSRAIAKMLDIAGKHGAAGTMVSMMYGFTAKQSAWIFSAGLASFALVMVMAGRMMPKLGPRKLAVAGGLVLGAGYVLGGFLGSTFTSQLVWIGLVGGAGIGLAYVVPIAVGVKWFPDKKGMVTGLAVAGFGFGATLWVKLAGSWWGGLFNTVTVFGLAGVQSVFVIYGIVFAVLVLLGSVVMVNPPEGWRPAGWTPPAANAAKPSGAVELNSGQMLATPQYWGLLLMFVGSALAGLMVISCISLFGIDALKASGAAKAAGKKTVEEVAAAIAGTAMAWYAILNGLGRIAWGMLSDKIGRKLALILMCIFQGAIMLLFFKMGGTEMGLIVGACIIGFNFGGNFALFPAATADFFGNKNVGKNYGWVFLAYGVAGIAGPQVAGIFKDRATAAGTGVSAWLTPFIIAGVACLVAAALGLILKPPKHEGVPEAHEPALVAEAEGEADGALNNNGKQ